MSGAVGAQWCTPIDWRAPWFEHVAEAGHNVQVAVQGGLSLPQAVNRCAPGPLVAVPQHGVPADRPYESFIFESACVPTRENLHDLFNALVWHRFPLAKRQLNRLQATEIERAGVGQVRGPLRDAITLFDENAALLQAPDALWVALRTRDWHRLFLSERALWAETRLVVFGHALLEKLVTPYKAITAHVLNVAVPLSLGRDAHAWDAWLAGNLGAGTLARKPFTPLPVLGVPGWWPANADAAFYRDPLVFRAPRPA